MQVFVDWYFKAGFDRIFAYARSESEAYDVDGVTWFIVPKVCSCPALHGSEAPEPPHKENWIRMGA